MCEKVEEAVSDQERTALQECAEANKSCNRAKNFGTVGHETVVIIHHA